jgi:hypothetical protein
MNLKDLFEMEMVYNTNTLTFTGRFHCVYFYVTSGSFSNSKTLLTQTHIPSIKYSTIYIPLLCKTTRDTDLLNLLSHLQQV